VPRRASDSGGGPAGNNRDPIGSALFKVEKRSCTLKLSHGINERRSAIEV
jgi:hypothetical protein